MKREVIKLPNGFFNKDYSIFVNLEVPKSSAVRKSPVTNCGEILVNTMYKTLYRVDFITGHFAWHIN